MRASSTRRALALSIALASAGASASASAAPRKYALSMLHFNVQYVAGGLVGFYPDAPELELSADAVEDTIVVESFEPVLDMLLAHPAWGADLELQGYMLDVMASRHAGVLHKLRVLAKRGQVDVVSFHYADQLFLAYPRQDWERSVTLNRATFARLDVPLSRTVFCQEGQAGPGLAAAMDAHGYETLLWPKNLWTYQHGDGPRAPLYRFGDVHMLTSAGTDFDDGEDGGSVRFWFVDDGELLATGGSDPYFPERFVRKPAAVAEAVAELAALEADGFAITTIAKYVAEVKGLVAAAEPPPLLDGTWQPNSTDGIRRWLGGFGLWWRDERDGDVRSLGAAAHRELLLAETVAAAAGLGAEEEIAAGFRLLALGQVSDATGINPFRGEIEYGVAHLSEALRIARDVLRRGKDALGGGALHVDAASGLVEAGEAPSAGAVVGEVVPVVVTSGDRAADVVWRRAGPGHHVATITFGVGDERLVSATFPGEMGDIVYTPGLADAPVSVPRGAFVFEHYALALSDGLIGLGGGRYVIKDQARTHVAAVITRQSGDVRFGDDTVPAGESLVWVFHVVDGTLEEAAAVARRLNVTPEAWR